MDISEFERRIIELERKLKYHGSQHESLGRDEARTLLVSANDTTIGKARRLNFVTPVTATYDKSQDAIDIGYSGSGSGSGLDADTLDGMHASSFALAATQVVAGDGLAGGGTLAAAMEFDVGPGDGIRVTANAVEVDTDHPFTWYKSHNFVEGLAVGGFSPITFGGDTEIRKLATNTLSIGADDDFQSPNFMSGISGWRLRSNGEAEFQDAWIRGSLHTSVFTVNEMHASGGTLVVLNASKIAKQINSSDNVLVGVGSTLNINVDASQSDGSCPFVKGDVLRVKGFISK